MSEYSEEEAERRQEARRAALRRGAAHAQSPTGRWFQRATKAWIEGREAPPVPSGEEHKRAAARHDLISAGLIFADRADRIAEAEAEHRARRRRADAEVAQRDHLHQVLRDSEGIDYADEYMRGAE